jgi:hypothetical protein
MYARCADLDMLGRLIDGIDPHEIDLQPTGLRRALTWGGSRHFLRSAILSAMIACLFWLLRSCIDHGHMEVFGRLSLAVLGPILGIGLPLATVLTQRRRDEPFAVKYLDGRIRFGRYVISLVLTVGFVLLTLGILGNPVTTAGEKESLVRYVLTGAGVGLVLSCLAGFTFILFAYLQTFLRGGQASAAYVGKSFSIRLLIHTFNALFNRIYGEQLEQATHGLETIFVDTNPIMRVWKDEDEAHAPTIDIALVGLYDKNVQYLDLDVRCLS